MSLVNMVFIPWFASRQYMEKNALHFYNSDFKYYIFMLIDFILKFDTTL